MRAWIRWFCLGLLAAFMAACATPVLAQATWITRDGLTGSEPVVLHFRREIELARLPAAFPVKVSADNRFILYVNGARVAEGPARGDLSHWRYEAIDLKPWLKRGHNVVAAEVWNTGKDAMPLAQISARTGFWLEGSGIDSGSQWRVSALGGHSFIWPYPSLEQQFGGTYYAAGAAESIDGAKADWDWNGTVETKADWSAAVPVLIAGETAPWTLEADALPPMAYVKTAPGKVVRTDLNGGKAFPKQAVTVSPHDHVTILIDRASMISAYPKLSVSGGLGATVTLKYAEALADAKGHKGDRDLVEDRKARGLIDTFLPDGSDNHTFQPLWWRTWRYLEITVTTGDQPLTLNGLVLYQSGYPLQQAGHFDSSDPELNKVWQIGWHTLQVDAHETYTDSAYWEQLQYEGDTRMTMLVTYAVTGDPRLPVQAIDAFGDLQRADGMLQGAYPSHNDNIIPTYALIWVDMLHDYWMQQPDTAPIIRNLPKARKVLAWYAPYVGANGLLTKVPDWSFIDWVGDLSRDQFPSYDPASGTSCLTSLSYLGALKDAADLENTMGDKAVGADDSARAAALTGAIRAQCWDETRGLFADDPSKTIFSQHSNALAVLYDVAPQDKMADILHKISLPTGIDAPDGMLESSYYFSWYIIRAYDHAGLSDHYIDEISTWKDLLKLHYTTWPEARGETRSDSHAWSAHPTADLLGIVAGVATAAPGYGAARVAPHVGNLTKLDAAVATPHGLVGVKFAQAKGLDVFDVTAPDGLPGTFEWQGKTWPLKAGINHFEVAPLSQ